MNRTLRLALVVLFGITLAACDSAGDDDTVALGAMQAEIDGRTWKAVNATANRMSFAGTAAVTVTGATIQGEAVSFTMTDTGTGEYPIDDTFTPARDVLSASYTAAPGQTYVAQSGTVTITRKDDAGVEGTFSFEARNQAGETRSVAGGRFNVGFGTPIGQ